MFKEMFCSISLIAFDIAVDYFPLLADKKGDSSLYPSCFQNVDLSLK